MKHEDHIPLEEEQMMCRGCGESYPIGMVPDTCIKCFSSSFEKVGGALILPDADSNVPGCVKGGIARREQIQKLTRQMVMENDPDAPNFEPLYDNSGNGLRYAYRNKTNGKWNAILSWADFSFHKNNFPSAVEAQKAALRAAREFLQSTSGEFY